MPIKLTAKGEELLQKLHAGELEKLTFTDMAIGSGVWTEEELNDDIGLLENVKLKQPISIKYAEKKDDKTFIFLSTTFSNKGVADTFYVYEVGVYALDGETEVLYAYDITAAGTPAQAVVQDQSIPQYVPVSLDIGISNVDKANLTFTADLSVISAEQFRGHTDDFENPHKVTKAHVGLGNVDDTSDLAKPISTAVLNALNGKQPTGDYATNGALNNGLAGKSNNNHNHSGVYQPVGDYATNGALNNGLAGKSNNGHSHDRVANANRADTAGTADYVNGFRFNWSGQGGQPTWLVGGNDNPGNLNVYNPSNFSVNYANSAANATNAGNADTVDGWHRDDIRNWDNLLNRPSIPLMPNNSTWCSDYSTGGSIKLPAGGTYAYIGFIIIKSTQMIIPSLMSVGVAPGGTSLFASASSFDFDFTIFRWRIA